jgi:hypothetical protein
VGAKKCPTHETTWVRLKIFFFFWGQKRSGRVSNHRSSPCGRVFSPLGRFSGFDPVRVKSLVKGKNLCPHKAKKKVLLVVEKSSRPPRHARTLTPPQRQSRGKAETEDGHREGEGRWSHNNKGTRPRTQATHRHTHTFTKQKKKNSHRKCLLFFYFFLLSF